MKKIFIWITSIIICAVSLIAVCTFDLILSYIFNIFEKVPFLNEILDFMGGFLDLGLTVLISIAISTSIWRLGHFIIKKINGEKIEFKKCPIYYINNLFIVLFFAAVIFLGFEFSMLIGKAVQTYTAEFQGFAKILMFFKSIKDTFLSVCNQNILLYEAGTQGLVLFGFNIFADRLID